MEHFENICLILVLALFLGCMSACKTHRDCKGRKKTVKTAMGGWL